jgi:hypothetical protein
MRKATGFYTVVRRSNGKFEAIGRNKHYTAQEGEWVIEMPENAGHKFNNDASAVMAAKHRYKSAKRYGAI